MQAAAVHRHDHLGLAGVGQHKAGILVGLLRGLGPCGLFIHALGHELGGVGILQRVDELEAFFCVVVHRSDKLGLGFGDGLDLRRDDIAEIFEPDIALALHAEAADAVAGDLRQEGAGHTLDAEGEAGVLNGAGMADIGKFLQKGGGLLGGQALQQSIDMRVRVAELGCGCYGALGVVGMGDQFNQHDFFFLL